MSAGEDFVGSGGNRRGQRRIEQPQSAIDLGADALDARQRH